MFCLNCSRSFFRICPPDALGWPPHFEFSRFFVAASRSLLTPILSDWSLVERFRNFPFDDMKMCIFSGYFLVMMSIRGRFIGSVGL